MTHAIDPLLIAAPDVGSLLSLSARAVQWLATFGVAVICGSIGICLYRVVRGPTLADRAAAVDVVGVQLIGLVILLTMLTGSLLFVDSMMILALLSFAGTVAVAQFVARPHMRELSAQSAPEDEDTPAAAGRREEA